METDWNAIARTGLDTAAHQHIEHENGCRALLREAIDTGGDIGRPLETIIAAEGMAYPWRLMQKKYRENGCDDLIEAARQVMRIGEEYLDNRAEHIGDDIPTVVARHQQEARARGFRHFIEVAVTLTYLGR